jgi:hypothetical protein
MIPTGTRTRTKQNRFPESCCNSSRDQCSYVETQHDCQDGFMYAYLKKIESNDASSRMRALHENEL